MSRVRVGQVRRRAERRLGQEGARVRDRAGGGRRRRKGEGGKKKREKRKEKKEEGKREKEKEMEKEKEKGKEREKKVGRLPAPIAASGRAWQQATERRGMRRRRGRVRSVFETE